jgi:hypothetical protein
MRNYITSPNIIKMIESWRMRWAAHAAIIGGEKRNTYSVLVRRPTR